MRTSRLSSDCSTKSATCPNVSPYILLLGAIDLLLIRCILADVNLAQMAHHKVSFESISSEVLPFSY